MTNIAVFILLSSIIPISFGQPVCQAPQGTLYTNTDLIRFTNCQLINGSLIMGDQYCTQTCTITDFSPLNNVQTITGSLIVQCCHTLSVIPSIPRLTRIEGTLRIYYNTGLRSISGFILGTVGNLEIAQNQLLHSIDSLQINRISGYISISHNPSLGSIRGLANLISIQGNELINGHALLILYNPVLTDISGLQSLSAINHGTVHIEGNTRLCYSGYPRWSYGSYGSRYSTGDKGIDWRTKLNSQYSWQYTWGGNGIPTLNIQGNGNHSTCVSTTCHSSCQTGAGCLGPSSSGLCGSCYQTSSINSCDEVQAPEVEAQNCVTLWPPTELPFSAIFGLLVACGGTLIIIVLIAICVAVYKIRKKYGGDEESKGSYNVNERNLESGSSYEPLNNTRMTEASSSSSSQARTRSNNYTNAFEMKETTTTTTTTSTKSPYEPEEYTYSQVIKKTPAQGNSSREETPSTTYYNTTTTHRQEREEKREEESEEEEEESEEEEEESEEEPRDDFMNEYETPSRKIQLIKEIGEGSFGKLFKGLASDILPTERMTDVIVKQSHSNASEDELEEFLEPAEQMRALKHENVLHLLGVCVDSPNMLIILEDCANGDFKSFLKKKRPQMEAMKKDGSLLKMMIEMAQGLNYLHEKSIAHNDFAARNCLVCADNRIKVGDYGISRQTFRSDYYTRTPGQTAWPVRWMAPEVFMEVKGVLKSTTETSASNVWSFGITLWEVCTFAEQPYPDMTDEEVIEQVARREYCNLRNPVPTFDPLCALFAIMMKCWKRDRERPNMPEILSTLQKVTLNMRGMELKESIRLKAAAKTKKRRARRESSQEPLLATSMAVESTEEEERETMRAGKPIEKEKKREEERKEERREERRETETRQKITVTAEVREETKEEKRKSNKKSTKKEAKASKKKQVTGDPIPTPPPAAPKVAQKEDTSDISDMDDIFYPSGAPPPPPPADNNDSWDDTAETPPQPPSQPPSQKESQRYSKESWDSFDDDYDDEQTDAVKTTPLPPNQFSQEDDDDDEEPPLPPDDLPPDLTPVNHSQTTNDWEESEPVTTPEIYPAGEITRTNPYTITKEDLPDDEEEIALPPPVPLEEDDIGTDEENLQPIEPVRLDSRGFEDSDEINVPTSTEEYRNRADAEDSDEINVPMQSEEGKTKAKTKASKKEEKEKEKARKKELKEKKKKEKQEKSSKKKKSKDEGERNDEPALVW